MTLDELIKRLQGIRGEHRGNYVVNVYTPYDDPKAFGSRCEEIEGISAGGREVDIHISNRTRARRGN